MSRGCICKLTIVNTTIEHGSSVLADTRLDDGTTTGMVLDKVGNVVDNTGNSHKITAVLALLLILFPGHDGELLERDTPVKLGALLVELLLLLLETALLNFVGTEGLEIISEAELLHGPDEPLGRIIYISVSACNFNLHF